MPSPTRIVTARHPSRIPKPPSRPAVRVEKPRVAKGSSVVERPEKHDPEALAAAADRMWRIMSGQEKG